MVEVINVDDSETLRKCGTQRNITLVWVSHDRLLLNDLQKNVSLKSKWCAAEEGDTAATGRHGEDRMHNGNRLSCSREPIRQACAAAAV